MTEREILLKKLSGAQFSALEMQLYLDTHKHDQEAFKSLQNYQKAARQYLMQYEEAYGPLMPSDLLGDTNFEWLNAPWPWENEMEAKK